MSNHQPTTDNINGGDHHSSIPTFESLHRTVKALNNIAVVLQGNAVTAATTTSSSSRSTSNKDAILTFQDAIDLIKYASLFSRPTAAAAAGTFVVPVPALPSSIVVDQKLRQASERLCAASVIEDSSAASAAAAAAEHQPWAEAQTCIDSAAATATSAPPPLVFRIFSDVAIGASALWSPPSSRTSAPAAPAPAASETSTTSSPLPPPPADVYDAILIRFEDFGQEIEAQRDLDSDCAILLQNFAISNLFTLAFANPTTLPHESRVKLQYNAIKMLELAHSIMKKRISQHRPCNVGNVHVERMLMISAVITKNLITVLTSIENGQQQEQEAEGQGTSNFEVRIQYCYNYLETVRNAMKYFCFYLQDDEAVSHNESGIGKNAPAA